jgi:hypothetical protein
MALEAVTVKVDHDTLVKLKLKACARTVASGGHERHTPSSIVREFIAKCMTEQTES